MASDLEALRPHPRTGDEAPVSYRAKHIRSLFDHIAALEAEKISLEGELTRCNAECDKWKAHWDAEKAENERLKAVISACHWYWPSDDTSSENCCCHPFEVVENHGEGEVIEVSRGGVVETMYCAYLRPAVDSDSDDQFWVHEATVEAAEAKLQAEVKRRSALR
ncbi:hypothetical protein GCM10019059_44820 [Camelimonas fluminis]|uniref:Uncharacterized protein n=1 Tax=Camelimonas fluminis TaxID=1576911 RepID=A0ABV7UCA9_9HYPH|nr:hypothetical protein [Camelimonas fluminis]GHE82203.1 hypothetical protein GCM10019059_44820 [Camelimonas fluminis]